MHPSMYMTVVFVLTLLRDVPQLVDGQSRVPVATTLLNTLLWERRINTSLTLLQTKGCKFFISNGNCTQLRARPRKDMNVYIASQENQRGKLSAVLPDKIKLVPTSYDAVIVIDPYPQHGLGHPILIFFIETTSSLNNCGRNQRSTYTRDPVTGSGECMTITQKSRRCTNRLYDRRRRRRCDINFLPTVFIAKAGREKTPILKCMSGLAGFGNCAIKINQQPLSDKCKNSKRCGVTQYNVRQNQCTGTCDYAVLLSGGWNAVTTTTKAQDNVRLMWSYLRQNGFKHKNIVVFSGYRYHLETDGNPQTKDSIPAENEFIISSHIKHVCASRCVDSFVIYLNKPTKSNGGMLIWDENNDGYAEESERYDIKEFIDDIRDCKAKHVTVIADQSFSGILVEKFRSLKRHLRRSLKNVVFIASSDADAHPVHGSFTKSWVKASYPLGNRPRCIGKVIEDIAATNTDEYTLNFEHGSQGYLDRTIYGGSCNKDLQDARKNDMRCTVFSRLQRKNMNRG